MIKVGVTGAGGRMGRALIKAVSEREDLELFAAIERAGSDFVGNDSGLIAGIGNNNIMISDSLADVINQLDALIDFTTPESSLQNLALCVQSNTKIVIGTTGFSSEQKQQIDAAGENIALVFASNMSVGVNLCLKLLQMAAKVLGDEVDVEIIEAHHRHKVDAPSGTAITMGEVVADALGRDLQTCAVYGRQGKTGERDRKTIGFETIRAGDIVGEHTVMFADIGERIEISHKASNRMIYANGAARAVSWLSKCTPGVYDMQDVLDLK